jgi:SAM-dependent methyltransferase
MTIPSADEISRWPGAERRNPPLHDRHHLVLEPLARALQESIEGTLRGRAGLDVLDVGCGAKPYLPLLAPYARSYRGLDMAPGPYVDDIGSAEMLPYPDASFDVVICTQAFEHLREPWTAVREIRRVLRPAGVALVSTHGVFLYHPDPPTTDQDYWRWTHAGLNRLFETNADWDRISVAPNGEVLACLAYVLAQFLGEAVDRINHPRLARFVMSSFNRTAKRLDARFPPRARTPRGGSLSANYLLTAVCAAAPTRPMV